MAHQKGGKIDRLAVASAKANPHPGQPTNPQPRSNPDHEKHRAAAVANIAKETTPEARLRAFMLGDVKTLQEIHTELSDPKFTKADVMQALDGLQDDRALDIPDIIHLVTNGDASVHS